MVIKAVENRMVRSLDLVGALVAESTARSSLLPAQPALAELANNNAERFGSWLSMELSLGLRVSPHVVVNARKPRHGTRPHPFLGSPSVSRTGQSLIAFFAMKKRWIGRPTPTLTLSGPPVDFVLSKAAGERQL